MNIKRQVVYATFIFSSLLGHAQMPAAAQSKPQMDGSIVLNRITTNRDGQIFIMDLDRSTLVKGFKLEAGSGKILVHEVMILSEDGSRNLIREISGISLNPRTAIHSNAMSSQVPVMAIRVRAQSVNSEESLKLTVVSDETELTVKLREEFAANNRFVPLPGSPQNPWMPAPAKVGKRTVPTCSIAGSRGDTSVRVGDDRVSDFNYKIDKTIAELNMLTSNKTCTLKTVECSIEASNGDTIVVIDGGRASSFHSRIDKSLNELNQVLKARLCTLSVGTCQIKTSRNDYFLEINGKRATRYLADQNLVQQIRTTLIQNKVCK